MKRNQLKTWLVGAVVTSAVATALIGFAHTDAGRPLLGLLRGAGCPLSLEAGDPKKVEAFRIAELEKHVGTVDARTSPALGFELGVARREEVRRWAQGLGAACRSVREESVLRCTGFLKETNAAFAISDAHLQFDEKGVLVAVDVYRTPPNPQAALGFVTTRAEALSQQVGPRTGATAAQSAEYLAARALNRVAVSFKYRRYTAEVSAMNFGDRGIAVREQYQYLPHA
jgi:hypothetical protein